MNPYVQPRPEVEGQLALLPQTPPPPRPHGNQRAKVLAALTQAHKPVDAHAIADAIGSQSGWVAKRLQELDNDGHARRAGTHVGRYGRPCQLWIAS